MFGLQLCGKLNKNNFNLPNCVEPYLAGVLATRQSQQLRAEGYFFAVFAYVSSYSERNTVGNP